MTGCSAASESRKKRKRRTTKECVSGNEGNSLGGAREEKHKKPRRAFQKKKWNHREKEVVRHHFKGNLTSRVLPTKEQIDSVLSQYPNVFERRSWRNIKDFVRNQIRKKNPFGFLED